jgi:hypothetical protein
MALLRPAHLGILLAAVLPGCSDDNESLGPRLSDRATTTPNT